jgi:hypothetical protein
MHDADYHFSLAFAPQTLEESAALSLPHGGASEAVTQGGTPRSPLLKLLALEIRLDAC